MLLVGTVTSILLKYRIGGQPAANGALKKAMLSWLVEFLDHLMALSSRLDWHPFFFGVECEAMIVRCGSGCELLAGCELIIDECLILFCEGGSGGGRVGVVAQLAEEGLGGGNQRLLLCILRLCARLVAAVKGAGLPGVVVVAGGHGVLLEPGHLDIVHIVRR